MIGTTDRLRVDRQTSYERATVGLTSDYFNQSTPVNPLTPTVTIMGTAMKHLVPDRVKPSFVSFDIRAL